MVDEKPTFASLSDLGKYHLEKSKAPSTSSQFKLPVFGTPSSGGGRFALPKLGKLSNIPTSSGAVTNLADFASASFTKSSAQTEIKTGGLVISNLFPLKSSNIGKSEPEPINIDLKAALFSPSEQKKHEKKQSVKTKPDLEEFVPRFVECDTTTSTSTATFRLDDNCELTTLREFKSRLKKLRPQKLSVVGRIIGKKFKQARPKVHHGYEVNAVIKRFVFDTPSPDDRILAHLNKVKK